MRVVQLLPLDAVAGQHRQDAAGVVGDAAVLRADVLVDDPDPVMVARVVDQHQQRDLLSDLRAVINAQADLPRPAVGGIAADHRRLVPGREDTTDDPLLPLAVNDDGDGVGQRVRPQLVNPCLVHGLARGQAQGLGLADRDQLFRGQRSVDVRDLARLDELPQPIGRRVDGGQAQQQAAPALASDEALPHLLEDARGRGGLVEERDVDGGAGEVQARLLRRLESDDGAVPIPRRRSVGMVAVDRAEAGVLDEVGLRDSVELPLNGQRLRPGRAQNPRLDGGVGDLLERVSPEGSEVHLRQAGGRLP